MTLYECIETVIPVIKRLENTYLDYLDEEFDVSDIEKQVGIERKKWLITYVYFFLLEMSEELISFLSNSILRSKGKKEIQDERDNEKALKVTRN